MTNFEKNLAENVVELAADKEREAEGIYSENPFDFSPSLLELTGKRIPISLFEGFMNVANLYAAFMFRVRAEIYYCYETEEFHLHIPRQKAHMDWTTKIEPEDEFVNYMLKEHGVRCEKVVEIHSHHNQDCTPTKAECESERKPQMTYVIVGNIVPGYNKGMYQIAINSYIKKRKYCIHEFKDIFASDQMVSVPNFDELDNAIELVIF